jgi:hypothetical protein
MSSIGEIMFNSINSLKKYKYNGEDYVSTKDLLDIKEYSKGCNASQDRMIKKKKLTSVVNGRVGLDDETIVLDSIISKRYTKKFAKLSEVLLEFNYLTNETNDNNTVSRNNRWILHDQRPLIKPDGREFAFFRDNAGVTYDVEMRGERTKNGIIFKCKDLEKVFEMGRLHIDLIKDRSGLNYDIDMLYCKDPHSNGNIQDKSLYLTYSGLKKLYNNCNESNRKSYLYLIKLFNNIYKFGKTKNINSRFKTHVLNYGKIFNCGPQLVLHLEIFGELHSTVESNLNNYFISKNLKYKFQHHGYFHNELVKLDNSDIEYLKNTFYNLDYVLKNFTDKSTKIKEFKDRVKMFLECNLNKEKKHTGDISCLYLLSTGIKENDKKVYKFGRTKHLDTRIKQHITTFGENLKLVKYCIIADSDLVEAESMFKERAEDFKYESKEEKYKNMTELIIMNKKEKEYMLERMLNISSKFKFDSKETIESIQRMANFEVEKAQHQIEIIKMKYDAKIKEIESENKEKELENQSKIKMLEMEIIMKDKLHKMEIQLKETIISSKDKDNLILKQQLELFSLKK